METGTAMCGLDPQQRTQGQHVYQWSCCQRDSPTTNTIYNFNCLKNSNQPLQVDWHSSSLLKLLPFPLHPPYVNFLHIPDSESKCHRCIEVKHGPLSFFMPQTSVESTERMWIFKQMISFKWSDILDTCLNYLYLSWKSIIFCPQRSSDLIV